MSRVLQWIPSQPESIEGMSSDEIEVTFNEALEEAYGIGTDDFLALRVDADEETTARLGAPPALGEAVGDEWFIERDAELLRLWNDRYPASALAFCDLVLGSLD